MTQHNLPDQLIDQHLDAVLKASGSALKRYSLPIALEKMREAMRSAMLAALSEQGAGEAAQPARVVEALRERLAQEESCVPKHSSKQDDDFASGLRSGLRIAIDLIHATPAVPSICGMPVVVDESMPADQVKFVHPSGRTDYLVNIAQPAAPTNTCKLTECQGKPRCAYCKRCDEAAAPTPSQAGAAEALLQSAPKVRSADPHDWRHNEGGDTQAP